MNGELNNNGSLMIYQNEKGDTKVDVLFQDGNIWMTQASIAELYQTKPQNITQHIKHIYEDGELDENRTCKEYLQVQTEGKRQIKRHTKHYSFDMILAIGYRVRTHVGIHFRNWATSLIHEYTQKGFVLNDERLKSPKQFGDDYFDELLERIKDIRASEQRFYEKVKAIYATSIDYDKDDKQTKLFFKTVQNKMHYSVHSHTAAEIIDSRADATKDNMGLTSWKGAVVRKGDVDIAKNYLSKDEVEALNRIVVMYLDYAEDMAKQHVPMHMADWENKLNEFLKFYGRNVLDNAGTVSAEKAKQKAYAEYEKFNNARIEKQKADFDELESKVESLQGNNK
ncbi:MAG: virulence RhuM family protein [Treponema sp.]|nr:virulence RhuM family protein [Treponema sp.]